MDGKVSVKIGQRAGARSAYTPGFKGKQFDSAGISAEGTVVSASAVPHCGIVCSNSVCSTSLRADSLQYFTTA